MHYLLLSYLYLLADIKVWIPHSVQFQRCFLQTWWPSYFLKAVSVTFTNHWFSGQSLRKAWATSESPSNGERIPSLCESTGHRLLPVRSWRKLTFCIYMQAYLYTLAQLYFTWCIFSIICFPCCRIPTLQDFGYPESEQLYGNKLWVGGESEALSQLSVYIKKRKDPKHFSVSRLLRSY